MKMISSKSYNQIFHNFGSSSDIKKYLPLSIENGGFGESNSIEIGIWNPVFKNCTVTFTEDSYMIARYYKIGKAIYITFGSRFNVISTSGSKYVEISGLPFTCSSVGNYPLSMKENLNVLEYGGNVPAYVYSNSTIISVRNNEGVGTNYWKTGTGQYLGFGGWYLID